MAYSDQGNPLLLKLPTSPFAGLVSSLPMPANTGIQSVAAQMTADPTGAGLSRLPNPLLQGGLGRLDDPSAFAPTRPLPMSPSPSQDSAPLRRLPAPDSGMPFSLLNSAAATPPGAPAPIAPNAQFDANATSRELAAQQALTDMQNHGSGVSHISRSIQGEMPNHPLLGKVLGGVAQTLGTVGDIGLRLVSPAAEMLTPGTEGNYQMRLRQQAGRVGEAQGELQKSATLQDSQAQALQRGALATQEQAKADSLLNPKPSNGQLLYDKNGSPIGFQSGDGMYYGPTDPNLPQGVRDVLGAAQRKQPTNAFELWQQQNPKGNAEDYLQLEAQGKNKPLDQQLIEAEASGDTHQASVIRNVLRETKVQPRIDIHNATAPPTGLPASTPGNVDPTVQAIIDGRVPAPNVRTKQGMALMHQVTQLDPTYDASRYNTYQRMQQEMTSGKTGQSINSLNTVQAHIDRALQNLPNNTSYAPLNWVKNTAEDLAGQNPTGKYQVDTTGITGEWSKLVNGGVATQEEMKHVEALLSPNASPQKMRENLAEVRAMTQGKLEGIQRQVQSAVHPGQGSNAPSSLPSGNATPAGMIQVQIPGHAPGYIPKASVQQFQRDNPGAQVVQ